MGSYSHSLFYYEYQEHGQTAGMVCVASSIIILCFARTENVENIQHSTGKTHSDGTNAQDLYQNVFRKHDDSVQNWRSF